MILSLPTATVNHFGIRRSKTYASSTGQLIAWVKVPNLSNTSDKVLYLYYGNPSATAPSSAFTQGVWDSNYLGVWHLPNGMTLSVNDSTGIQTTTNHNSVGANQVKLMEAHILAS